MDFNMLDSALLALQNFVDLKIMFFLMCGVLIGLILGVIPGLGGLTG